MLYICVIVVRSVSKASLDYVRPIAQRDKLRLIRILAPKFKSSSFDGLFAFWRSHAPNHQASILLALLGT